MGNTIEIPMWVKYLGIEHHRWKSVVVLVGMSHMPRLNRKGIWCCKNKNNPFNREDLGVVEGSDITYKKLIEIKATLRSVRR